TSPLRHARQNVGGGPICLEGKMLGTTSPLRHESQQGSVSASPPSSRRPFHLFVEDMQTRYAERTAEHYVADAQDFLSWLEEKGIRVSDVRPEDLQRYQGELYAVTMKGGRPYAASTIQTKLVAVKTLFRFLVRRGALLLDPSSQLELPRIEKRLPRLILSGRGAGRIGTPPPGGSPLVLRGRAAPRTLYAHGV